MTTQSDATLLSAFARKRDEAAFRVLVDRHLSLVFHAAERKSGSRVMAEEIAQNVFCAVAAKAGSLARHPERFVPWLHRATLYESTKAMRYEASQQRRKGLLHPDSMPSGDREHDAAWAGALAHLDDALDRLPEKDRRVLMLHFFEKLSFPRIGGLLGKSPAAVQKQSVRALDKLSQILRSRGIVAPAGVLAAGMLAESAKAVPVGLVTYLPARVLTLSPALALSHGAFLMLAGKSKILVPCGILLLGLPLALQQLSIARAERELAGLRRVSPSFVTAKRQVSDSPGLVKISASLDLVRLAEEAGETEHSQRVKSALKRKLASLSASELSGLLDGARTVNANIIHRLMLAELLAYALAEKDLALLMESTARGWMTELWAPELYERWTVDDPAAARAWLEKMQADPEYRTAIVKEEATAAEKMEGFRSRLEGQLERMDSEDERQEKIAWIEGESLRGAYEDGALVPFQAKLLKYLLKQDADKAISFLESFPPHTRQMALITGAYGHPREPLSPAEAGSWLSASRLLPEAGREMILSDFAIRAMGENREALDLSKVEPFLQEGGGLPEERWQLAEAAAKQVLGHDPSPERQAEVLAWLERVVPSEAAAIQEQACASIHAGQRSEALGDLEKFSRQQGPLSDEDIIRSLNNRYFRGDLTERALQLADKIEDAAMREGMKQRVLERAR